MGVGPEERRGEDGGAVERTVVIDSLALRDMGGFLPLPRSIARHPALTPAAKITYAQLLAYGWEKEFSAPAQERLAEDLAMSERNLRNILVELRDLGLLAWERRGQGRPNQYFVKLPANIAGQDRHSTSGQDGHDRQSTSGLDRQPASGPSIEKKSSIEKGTSASQGDPDDVAGQNLPLEAVALADRLRERILANKPDTRLAQKSVARWANTFRLMLERDGRQAERVAAVIDWCQADNFWRSNILSADKLREKFDRLELQMQSRGTQRPSATQSPTHPDHRPAGGDHYADDRRLMHQQQARLGLGGAKP